MKKVVFKVKTLDRDTRVEYLPSNDAVEVSEAFAARLAAYDPVGVMFEVEGIDYAKKPSVPTVKLEPAKPGEGDNSGGGNGDDSIEGLRAKYLKLFGKPAHVRSGVAKLQAEIEEFEKNNPSTENDVALYELRSQYAIATKHPEGDAFTEEQLALTKEELQAAIDAANAGGNGDDKNA